MKDAEGNLYYLRVKHCALEKMGNYCCSRESPDAGRPLLYEKIGPENGEKKGGVDEEKAAILQTNESNTENTGSKELFSAD